MSALQKSLRELLLRLDRMGMRAQQAVADSLRAARDRDVEAGERIDENDSIIDREEVEIEQECIRLLALYQPAAIDLRTICMIIKVNSDLERIADKAASIGRRVKHLVVERLEWEVYPGFDTLAVHMQSMLRWTVELFSVCDLAKARQIIEYDENVNQAYKDVIRAILDQEEEHPNGAETVLTLIQLARAMERIADHCVNIAEDIIFWQTGDIVRHVDASKSEE